MVQHNLNQELPYASVLDAERDDAFNLAVTGLRQALTTGDLQRAAVCADSTPPSILRPHEVCQPSIDPC